MPTPSAMGLPGDVTSSAFAHSAARSCRLDVASFTPLTACTMEAIIQHGFAAACCCRLIDKGMPSWIAWKLTGVEREQVVTKQ